MNKKRAIEITAQDVYSVNAALRGGATRVELCSALDVAGLTPSIGLLERSVEAAKNANADKFVDVLVRPRDGDFVYNDDEVMTAVYDIRRLVAAGAAGVVVGVLNEDLSVNTDALKRMIEAAGEAHAGFHRAFDVVADQFEALERLVDLGILRVLTSGGAPVTGEGLERIRDLVKAADGRIEIMAGGGLKVPDIPTLFNYGVDAVHLSARKTIVGGPNRPGETGKYSQVDEELVRAAVSAAAAA